MTEQHKHVRDMTAAEYEEAKRRLLRDCATQQQAAWDKADLRAAIVRSISDKLNGGA